MGTIFTVLLLILFLPADAYAWGPATHLELGREVLSHLSFLAPATANLIKKYPYDYLYGNISADIVIGKNLVEELKHCHNWSFGFKLLKKAEKDSQRAFTYGYLSHLAADTVAHNHFIPEMMIRSFKTRTLRHIYWEMRFDALVDKSVWQIPEKIVKEVHEDNDRLLSATLEGTPLSFKTNKRIFSSVLSISRVDNWHHMLNHLSKQSKWVLHKDEKERFFNITLESIKDLLTDGEDAKCTKKDPKGTKNLAAASKARKDLKALAKKGGNFEGPMERSLKEVML